MSYNNSPYDAIGTAIVGELFKQAEDIFPINDAPTAPRPSLFQRLTGWIKPNTPPAVFVHASGDCDEEMSAQPCI